MFMGGGGGGGGGGGWCDTLVDCVLFINVYGGGGGGGGVGVLHWLIVFCLLMFMHPNCAV